MYQHVASKTGNRAFLLKIKKSLPSKQQKSSKIEKRAFSNDNCNNFSLNERRKSVTLIKKISNTWKHQSRSINSKSDRSGFASPFSSNSTQHNNNNNRVLPHILSPHVSSVPLEQNTQQRQFLSPEEIQMSVLSQKDNLQRQQHSSPFNANKVKSTRHQLTQATQDSHHLPVLDASALLDPAVYCRKSARRNSTGAGNGQKCRREIDGMAAAERLHAGRKTVSESLQQQRYHTRSSLEDEKSGDSMKEWLSVNEMPRQELQNFPSLDRNLSHVKRPLKSFALSGHGVPVQLLNDHLDLGRTVLGSLGSNVTSCSFHNSHEQWNIDWMRYQLNDGNKKISPWRTRVAQGCTDDDLDHRLSLYLTVMNRISTTFARVVDPADFQHYGEPRLRPYRYWRVVFFRGLSVQPSLMPQSRASNICHPIVQLKQRIETGPNRTGSTVTNGIKISLQGGGFADHNEFESHDVMPPVTLVFHSCSIRKL